VKDRVRDLDDEFARLVAQARAEGRTVRSLADLLGIGPSTVQDLTRRGKELLEEK
jgi:DNA-directed RNA polymerase specialized sigma24 family protein